jgi:hypothetical protein
MYFQIGNEKIILDFNRGINAKCEGPEIMYYIECAEYRGLDTQPYLLDGFHFSSKDWWAYKHFSLPIEFYMDFEVNFYKFDDEFGLKKFFTHRFNETDQLIRFYLDTENEKDAEIWLEKILLYKKLKNCHIDVVSYFPNIDSFSDIRYKDRNLHPYKTYRIGRFFKDSQDWRTVDPRKENLIWYGNWKTFWSYQHPRLWKNLSSEEIANDILGL